MNVSISVGLEPQWSGVSDVVMPNLLLIVLLILSVLIVLREFRKLRRELVWWQRVALGFHPRKKRRFV